MKTKAFFIKYAMTIVVLWIVLGLFFGASFGNIFLIGTILTVVSYIGDLFILPNVGNFVAAAGDFLLAFFGVWALGTILFGESIAVLSAAFLSALFVGVGELYFHRYYRDHVMGVVDNPKPATSSNYTRANLQTEFSEDFDEGLEKKANNDITNSSDEGPVK